MEKAPKGQYFNSKTSHYCGFVIVITDWRPVNLGQSNVLVLHQQPTSILVVFSMSYSWWTFVTTVPFDGDVHMTMFKNTFKGKNTVLYFNKRCIAKCAV